MEKQKEQGIIIPMANMFVVVDIGERRIVGKGMMEYLCALHDRDIVVKMYVEAGIPEERVNVQVLNIEEALRGGYRCE